MCGQRYRLGSVWISLILLKTENNKKVTVHAFGTVHKLKITIHGQ